MEIMMDYTIKTKESIYDICINFYGSLDFLSILIGDNDVDIFSDLSGTIIKLRKELLINNITEYATYISEDEINDVVEIIPISSFNYSKTIYDKTSSERCGVDKFFSILEIPYNFKNAMVIVDINQDATYKDFRVEEWSDPITFSKTLESYDYYSDFANNNRVMIDKILADNNMVATKSLRIFNIYNNTFIKFKDNNSIYEQLSVFVYTKLYLTGLKERVGFNSDYTFDYKVDMDSSNFTTYEKPNIYDYNLQNSFSDKKIISENQLMNLTGRYKMINVDLLGRNLSDGKLIIDHFPTFRLESVEEDSKNAYKLYANDINTFPNSKKYVYPKLKDRFDIYKQTDATASVVVNSPNFNNFFIEFSNQDGSNQDGINYKITDEFSNVYNSLNSFNLKISGLDRHEESTLSSYYFAVNYQQEGTMKVYDYKYEDINNYIDSYMIDATNYQDPIIVNFLPITIIRVDNLQNEEEVLINLTTDIDNIDYIIDPNSVSEYLYLSSGIINIEINSVPNPNFFIYIYEGLKDLVDTKTFYLEKYQKPNFSFESKNINFIQSQKKLKSFGNKGVIYNTKVDGTVAHKLNIGDNEYVYSEDSGIQIINNITGSDITLSSLINNEYIQAVVKDIDPTEYYEQETGGVINGVNTVQSGYEDIVIVMAIKHNSVKPFNITLSDNQTFNFFTETEEYVYKTFYIKTGDKLTTFTSDAPLDEYIIYILDKEYYDFTPNNLVILNTKIQDTLETDRYYSSDHYTLELTSDKECNVDFYYTATKNVNINLIIGENSVPFRASPNISELSFKLKSANNKDNINISNVRLSKLDDIYSLNNTLEYDIKYAGVNYLGNIDDSYAIYNDNIDEVNSVLLSLLYDHTSQDFQFYHNNIKAYIGNECETTAVLQNKLTVTGNVDVEYYIENAENKGINMITRTTKTSGGMHTKEDIKNMVNWKLKTITKMKL